MDKEYLIHNIDYKDNPEDQHLTVDITLSNLDVSGQDVTADVGIDTYVNGTPARSSKYEDVSLTGAGGGGVLPVEKCTITFQNIRVEGDPLTDPVTVCEVSFNLNVGDYYFGSASGVYTTENGTYNDSKIELIIPTEHENPTEILSLAFTTENGTYVWDTTFSPVISGDATFDSDSGVVHVTGNCTLSPDTFLD